MRTLAACISGILLLVMTGSYAAAQPENTHETKVSWEQALEVAEGLAPQYGYDLDYMNIELLLDVTPWENRFPGLQFFKQPKYQDIELKLSGRHYWAVNCLPTFPRYGGSFCVFVDAESGEVLHVFTGW